MQLQEIQQKIYELRGQKVMLDSDLATLYGLETRTLNQAVKRNAYRYPGDFMFQVSLAEFEIMKSQFATPCLYPKHLYYQRFQKIKRR